MRIAGSVRFCRLEAIARLVVPHKQQPLEIELRAVWATATWGLEHSDSVGPPRSMAYADNAWSIREVAMSVLEAITLYSIGPS